MNSSARRNLIDSLDADEVEALEKSWLFTARPEQLPPPGDWRVWLFMAGRGAGKTRSASEYINAMAYGGQARRIGLLGRSAGDCRDTIIEGEAGIMRTADPDNMPIYEPSKRRITWPNGAIATAFNATQPEALRGPSLDLAWVDELCAHPSLEAWVQLQMCLRIGTNPRTIITTTPRPMIELKRLIGRDGTVVTRGKTADNKTNLSAAFIDAIYDEFGGTSLGRQELEGVLLDELPGALFSRKLIDDARCDDHPSLERIVVAVDPATTNNSGSDESGIIVAGICQRQFYVLADYSMRASPDAVCRRAIEAYHEHSADRIVFEANQGGDTWRTIVNGIDQQVATRNVHASRGKVSRAEPVSARYEQGRCSHLKKANLDTLEDQMCNYVPGLTRDSPDRMDALVWAITELDSKRNREILINPGENYSPQVFF